MASAKTVEKDRISEADGYGRLMVEAERDAEELRARAWTKEGPAGIFLPVDPFAIATDLGIQVFTGRGLSLDISGMLKKKAGYEDPEILLNAADSLNRLRFTCAHELGHYTLRSKTGEDDAWDYVDGRDLLAGARARDEIYANEFAAELLMPRDIVLERARASDSNIAALAVEFGVTGDAMRFRLDGLDLS